jgi:hypothetical protein
MTAKDLSVNHLFTKWETAAVVASVTACLMDNLLILKTIYL